jgi:RNA polymerase sigma-32 factor
MVTGKQPRAGRKRPSAVIDVDASERPEPEAGKDAEAEAESESESEAEAETESDATAELDPDLDLAAGVIDIGDGGEVDADPELEERLVSKAQRKGAKADKRGSSLAVRDPLAAYMNEARRYPLLTRRGRARPGRPAWSSTATPRRRASWSRPTCAWWSRSPTSTARRYRNLLDLVQEGNVGLMQAVSKSTTLPGRQAVVVRGLVDPRLHPQVRAGQLAPGQDRHHAGQRKLFFNLRKERERLEQQGFDVTTARLAESLDVSEKDVIDMERRLAAPEASLDAPVGSGDDDQTRTRLDYLPSDDARPDQAFEQSQFAALLKGKLEAFAATLTGREETIFRERWLTENPQTLQEIGDKYGVSRERARQLEKRMLTRLRKYLEDELGTAIDIDAMVRE